MHIFNSNILTEIIYLISSNTRNVSKIKTVKFHFLLNICSQLKSHKIKYSFTNSLRIINSKYTFIKLSVKWPPSKILEYACTYNW